MTEPKPKIRSNWTADHTGEDGYVRRWDEAAAGWFVLVPEGDYIDHVESRQAWAEEAMRLDAENERLRDHMRPVLVSGGPNMEVCYGVAGKPGECTSRSAHLFGCPDYASVSSSVLPDGEAQ